MNRVGQEELLNFAGGSFVVYPAGQVVARAPEGEDFILLVECDLSQVKEATAQRFFLPDRRPDFYRHLKLIQD